MIQTTLQKTLRQQLYEPVITMGLFAGNGS